MFPGSVVMENRVLKTITKKQGIQDQDQIAEGNEAMNKDSRQRPD